MTNTRDLFESVGRPEIEAWIEERRQEDLRLDFKVIRDGWKLSRDDRKNLAIAVSGLANSDGGLVVWGVEASADEDGVDAASAIVPIESVRSAFSQMHSHSASATAPIVDGVEHKLIDFGDDSGVIVTLVPPSDRGPHMALLGENRYYKRSGDSFRRLEHFDLADMFGRRPQPLLEFSQELTHSGFSSGPQGRSVNVNLVVGLANHGRGTARFPLLRVRVTRGRFTLDAYGLDGNRNTGLPALTSVPGANWYAFGGDANSAVHPGDVLHVTKLKLEVREDTASVDDSTIEYEFAAEGVPLTRGTVEVRGSEVLDHARRIFASAGT